MGRIPIRIQRERGSGKKLIEAGRAWAESLRSVDEDYDDGSAAIMLPDLPPPRPPKILRVHPENWKAFEIFDACHTQWRLVVGMGGVVYQGLDYSSVTAVIQAFSVKDHRKIFNQIRALEAGALSVLNERKDVPDNPADSW